MLESIETSRQLEHSKLADSIQKVNTSAVYDIVIFKNIYPKILKYDSVFVVEF